ncbi:MAG: hypothetical protein Q9159_004186 [Coniocarpon cinnabarinum]
MATSKITVTSLLLSSGLAQFVTPPTDLQTAQGNAGVQVRYKTVPAGICEQDPNVKSYSGYADVEDNRHIFWWFFEAREKDATEAPLTVWINGGPGSSSMIGLFQELGPCGVDFNGNVYNNPFSWSNASNMLFIDEPITTGFSYSIPVPGYADDDGNVITLPDNNCPDYAVDSETCGTWNVPDPQLTSNLTQNSAPDMWKTLQGFMGAFPQYSRNGFHFTTESYGGHYGPVFNEYFEMQNAAAIPGAMNISLKSVMIGNGWYEPLIQYQAYYNFTVSPGNTYDFNPFNESISNQMYNSLYGVGNCRDQEVACATTGRNDVCALADVFCANNIESVLDNIPNRDEYDIRELSPDPFPYGFFVDYLNRADVQAAIGAYTNYTESSALVGNAFGNTGDDSRESMTIEDIRSLLEQGIYVTLYAGDADYNCNWLGGQVVASEVQAPNYDKAGYVNITTSDGIVHGQVRQAGNFAFARVYFSGHEVPFYQPLLSLEMFERSLAGKDMATGTQALANVLTTGPMTSDFREGNSTVQFEVLPANATYNTATGAPDGSPPVAKRAIYRSDGGRMEKPSRRHARRSRTSTKKTERSSKLEL